MYLRKHDETRVATYMEFYIVLTVPGVNHQAVSPWFPKWTHGGGPAEVIVVVTEELLGTGDDQTCNQDAGEAVALESW